MSAEALTKQPVIWEDATCKTLEPVEVFHRERVVAAGVPGRKINACANLISEFLYMSPQNGHTLDFGGARDP